MTVVLFQPNTKAKSAEVNSNFSFLSGDRLIGFDVSGGVGAAKPEFDIGDLTEITNGSLAGDLLGRSGKAIKVYNAAGALLGSVTYNDLLNLVDAQEAVRGTSFLSKRITLSNGTDTAHDIDFAAGSFIFDDGSGQAVSTALTKRIDATWAAGNNQGGLDTGAVVANTTYHMFAIYNTSTLITDYLFSVSLSPTLPSGYTKKKRVASLKTNASANIRQFTQSSKLFLYDDIVVDSFTSSTSRVFRGVDIPTNITCQAVVSLQQSNTTQFGDGASWITSPLQNDKTPNWTGVGNAANSYNLYSHWSVAFRSEGEFMDRILTTDATIGYRSNNVNLRIHINTQGWVDNEI